MVDRSLTDILIEVMKQGLEGVSWSRILPPGQNYNKMSGRGRRFNENLIKNTIQKRSRKIYLDRTNKCQYVIKDECQYMYGGFKQFCLPFLEFQGP